MTLTTQTLAKGIPLRVHMPKPAAKPKPKPKNSKSTKTKPKTKMSKKRVASDSDDENKSEEEDSSEEDLTVKAKRRGPRGMQKSDVLRSQNRRRWRLLTKMLNLLSAMLRR